MASSKPKKPNIAERVKTLLSSFILSSNDDSESRCDTPLNVAPAPKVSSRHEAFIARVEGYNTLTWFGKPLQLSPVRCARYGWMNTARDTLRCVSCREIIYCKLPSPSDESYNKTVQDIETKLVNAHRINCSWRVNPCQGVWLHELVSDRESAVEQYISRLSTLQSVSKLPPIDLEFTEDPMCVTDQLKQLLKETQLSGMLGVQNTGTNACLIALLGWSIRTENKDVLSCSYCCRKIGIWKYLSESKALKSNGSTNSVTNNGNSEVDTNDGNENGSSDGERKKRIQTMTCSEKFNPVNEHKYWCAWILKSPSSNHNTPIKSNIMSAEESTPPKTDSLPGWKWYMYTMLPQLNPSSISTSKRLIGDIKTIPPYEGLKTIRHLFKDWASTDDISVDLDKSLSPKKGVHTTSPKKSVDKSAICEKSVSEKTKK